MDKARQLRAADRTQVYDLIKIAVEILVVLQHITVMYSDHGAVAQVTSSRMLASVYSVLAVGTMPIFMCICGAVYSYCLSIGKYKNSLRFIGGKFMRLMIPYYVFSALIVAPVVIKLGIVSWSYPEFLLYGTLMGGLTRHLWFCMSLFCIFILCAIFKRALVNGSPLIILPIVCVISYVGTLWTSPYFQLHQTLRFTLYFYFGMLIDRYWCRFAPFLQKHALLLAAAGAAVWLSVLLSPQIISYFPAFGAILFVIAAASAVNTARLGSSGVYLLLKRDSFGIYLLHPMMIYLIYYFFRESTVNPYIISSLTFVAVYLASIMLTEIIRKLGLGVVIGEKKPKNAANMGKNA